MTVMQIKHKNSIRRFRVTETDLDVLDKFFSLGVPEFNGDILEFLFTHRLEICFEVLENIEEF